MHFWHTSDCLACGFHKLDLFLSQYIMVWCNFIYTVIAHICIPVSCVQLSHLETSLERRKVAFIVPFPGSSVKIQWALRMRGSGSLLLSFHLMQLNFTAMVSVPGVLNVMCGDPWCHPASAAEVLHAFLCLFGYKQQYLSSDGKLGHVFPTPSLALYLKA